MWSAHAAKSRYGARTISVAAVHGSGGIGSGQHALSRFVFFWYFYVVSVILSTGKLLFSLKRLLDLGADRYCARGGGECCGKGGSRVCGWSRKSKIMRHPFHLFRYMDFSWEGSRPPAPAVCAVCACSVARIGVRAHGLGSRYLQFVFVFFCVLL